MASCLGPQEHEVDQTEKGLNYLEKRTQDRRLASRASRVVYHGYFVEPQKTELRPTLLPLRGILGISTVRSNCGEGELSGTHPRFE